VDLDEIKKEALKFKAQNKKQLSSKVLELKNKGVAFLGCVVFVQTNQQASLTEARKITLALDCWTTEEKASIDFFHQLMMSEFNALDE